MQRKKSEASRVIQGVVKMATHEGRISALEEAVKTIKDNQIDPERLKAIEGILDKNEALSDVALAAISSRTEEAHVMATEAKEMAAENNTLILQMPAKVMEAIKAEARDKPKTPWDRFKAKIIDSLATLVSGGIVAVVVWVAIQILKG